MSVPTQILLCNHHADSNRVLSKLLHMQGFKVVITETLAEATDQLRAHDFDVFICRVGMPDGCGAEAILRAYKDHNIPGIAIWSAPESGRAIAHIPTHALRAALRMPFSLDDLKAAIAQALAPRTDDQLPCPDCKGKGMIQLLVSTVTCETCSGQGIVHAVAK